METYEMMCMFMQQAHNRVYHANMTSLANFHRKKQGF